MEGARHFAVALGAGAFKLPTVADLVRAIANASRMVGSSKKLGA